jgi:hypothetical protein
MLVKIMYLFSYIFLLLGLFMNWKKVLSIL